MLVQQIIQKLLKIDTTVLIDRAHRAGTTIVVRFTNYKDKACVLRNAYKLRRLGSNVGISEDFSKTVREKRKGLMDLRKDYQARGVKTNLVFDKLVFIFDLDTQEIKRVQDARFGPPRTSIHNNTH